MGGEKGKKGAKVDPTDLNLGLPCRLHLQKKMACLPPPTATHPPTRSSSHSDRESPQSPTLRSNAHNAQAHGNGRASQAPLVLSDSRGRRRGYGWAEEEKRA